MIIAIRVACLLISLGVAGYAAYKSLTREGQARNRPYGSNFRNFNDRSATNCLVCFAEFDRFSQQEELALPCKHKFHKYCISQVFENEVENGRLCPVCAQAVSEEFLKKFF